MKSYITVKDILQRKHFESIEVLAGKEGLNNAVKWVHVVEVTNIRNLLNGNELILSTGVAWKEEKKHFVSILEQLIDSNAAGLCIEIGTYTSKIPQEIINIANQFHFPIVLFHKEVPFVEITQDIHALLINRQYQIISDLENYSQTLSKKLLTIEHYIEILKYIHHFLHVQVMIIFNTKEVECIPEIFEPERKTLLNALIDSSLKTQYSIAKVPIHLLGENYAELIIATKERTLTEFDQLILDRTATALAQLLLRDLYVEEKGRVEEAEWLTGWLEGVHSEETIMEYLSYHSPTIKPKGAFVCICNLHSFEKYSKLDLTYYKLFFRTIFEQQGFRLFTIEKRNTIIFIILDERNPSTWKKRMKEGIYRLKKAESQKGNQKSKQIIGIGKYVSDLKCIYKSYQTALKTIRIQDRLSDQSESYFYDDLHIFRLISLVNRHLDLHEIVLEYLEPVIQYDKKYNGKLMETLKTYLSCNGSKQETAKKLYIVRQTLYHRIQKLEKLLGEDFMIPEKRLAIEFMVLSYEFLISSKQMKEMGLEAY
ncbi:PucR family transcriptional regulator [Heyndrickxia sp. NPDC080065]|uniref:PucR family transcriptional regulator n=1 Tax=Heyndrickxia sp. NPDC080065 TaxID=3390568 RepID=UPI003D04BA1F